jgi:transcriptional regulator with XRE-family HTH domain
MTTIDTTTAWAPQRRAIREELKRQEMKQSELARKIGVTDKHMSQMLNGKTDGRVGHWVAMASALGMEWQLRPLDPNEALIDWVREELGLQIEPWQAAWLRRYLADN